GTFFLYSKRLHNLHGGFTHYRNYRAGFSYFCPKFALIVKKSLDMNVYYGRIGLRNMKGVKQMNKQLVIQQAIFYHTLLSKQENKAH
ncbi:hypothetical protein ACJBVZ_08080, partial [Streptococcus suis]